MLREFWISRSRRQDYIGSTGPETRRALKVLARLARLARPGNIRSPELYGPLMQSIKHFSLLGYSPDILIPAMHEIRREA
ncbi:MAG: hypothetical protein Q9212_004409 [Teloschistes hypoglaucus]